MFKEIEEYLIKELNKVYSAGNIKIMNGHEIGEYLRGSIDILNKTLMQVRKIHATERAHKALENLHD